MTSISYIEAVKNYIIQSVEYKVPERLLSCAVIFEKFENQPKKLHLTDIMLYFLALFSQSYHFQLNLATSPAFSIPILAEQNL